MWDNGQTGANDQVLMAFGDTFGDCSVASQQWRSNTLFRSADHNLSDGMSVPDPAFGNVYAGSPVLSATPPGSNFSRQIIASLNLAPTEVTITPNRWNLGGDNAVRQFYVGQAVGQSGPMDHELFCNRGFDRQRRKLDRQPWNRPSERFYFSVPSVWFNWGNQNFQQGAFVRRDGYLYSYGTPSGRCGLGIRVARPRECCAGPQSVRILEPTVVEFLRNRIVGRKQTWAATPVISAPVSEMSVQYNDYLNKYIALYTDGSNNVVMRTADNPQGRGAQRRRL